MGWHSSSCRGVNLAPENQKDYYRILDVDYDATEDAIRTSYLRLALKWHPDKHNGDSAATLRFQEINEAYKVLSDPVKRQDYDLRGEFDLQDYSITEYLNRFKGMILTCNGLGMSDVPKWASQFLQIIELHDKVVRDRRTMAPRLGDRHDCQYLAGGELLVSRLCRAAVDNHTVPSGHSLLDGPQRGSMIIPMNMDSGVED